MEDEIDLRKIASVWAAYWKLILGLAIVSGLVAFIISSIIQPMYEATALVAVTRPRYQLEFDPRIESVNPSAQQPYRAYPELALNDDLLLSVMDATNGSSTADQRDLTEFRGRLDAESGADPSLVRLHVTHTDAMHAQKLVNAWASLYVQYTNELFQQQASDVAFFEAQVTGARSKLEAAEQALIEFQGRNSLLQVSAQLTSTQTTLADFLAVSRSTTLLIQDAQSLRQQLARRNSSQPAEFIDELTALYLQVNTLSVRSPIPIDFNLGDNAALQARTVGDQIAALEALVAALQDKSQQAAQHAEGVSAELRALQQAQQTALVELDRLIRDRDVASETYLTLTRKLAEASVASGSTNTEVRLASQAALPTMPVSPRRSLNTVLGVVLGLILGALGALALGTRRSSQHVTVERAESFAGGT